MITWFRSCTLKNVCDYNCLFRNTNHILIDLLGLYFVVLGWKRINTNFLQQTFLVNLKYFGIFSLTSVVVVLVVVLDRRAESNNGSSLEPSLSTVYHNLVSRIYVLDNKKIMYDTNGHVCVYIVYLIHHFEAKCISHKIREACKLKLCDFS